jgi:hypothetical protein
VRQKFHEIQSPEVEELKAAEECWARARTHGHRESGSGHLVRFGSSATQKANQINARTEAVSKLARPAPADCLMEQSK